MKRDRLRSWKGLLMLKFLEKKKKNRHVRHVWGPRFFFPASPLSCHVPRGRYYCGLKPKINDTLVWRLNGTLLLFGIFSIWLVNNHFTVDQGNKWFHQPAPALIASDKHSSNPWKLNSVSCIMYYVRPGLFEGYKLPLPPVYSVVLTPLVHLSFQSVTNNTVTQSSPGPGPKTSEPCACG